MCGRFRTLCGAAASVLVYAVIVILTPLEHFGDTSYYVQDILAYREHKDASVLVEAGHLLWRPLGYAVASIRTMITYEPFDANLVLQGLVGLNWLFGLLFVVFTYLAATRLSTPFVSFLIASSAVMTNGFVNYVHSGCSYIPGLACVSAAFYAILSGSTHTRKMVAASLFICLAVSMWLLYVLSLPAVVLLLAFDADRNRVAWRRVVVATIVSTLAVLVPYACAVYVLGIDSANEAVAWFWRSSHGITHERGMHRAIFGFARSFFYMGDDGTLFKRFLLKDPYNPVYVLDLLRVSLLKVAFFYIWFFAMFGYSILPSYQRAVRYVTLLQVMCVFGFAVMWQGGDMERYFPLIPALVFAAASVIGNSCALPLAVRYVNSLFIIALLLVNVATRSHEIRTSVNIGMERITTLSKMVDSGIIAEDDLVILVTPHDELFGRGRFLSHNWKLPKLDYPVWTGHKDVARWRQSMSAKIMGSWREGNSVWVSTRLLASKPKAEWKWIEGDDPRVSWNDVRLFFSSMEYGRSVGGEDGFLLLLKNERNESRVSRYLHLKPVTD